MANFVNYDNAEDLVQGIGDKIDTKQNKMQFTTMPTAAVGLLGQVVQYLGATSGSYTNGYFYECVSDGESTPTYSWQQVDVQADNSRPTEITWAAYQLLTTEQKQAKRYLITDYPGSDTSDKADKVSGATAGNFAGLDSSGNLTDSGKKASDFATASHNQASNTINAMTGYSKASTAAAIATTDTLNEAIGKLEKTLDGKGTSNLTIGTTAGTACEGNDSRLSDSRTPTAHNQAASTISAGTLAGRVQANATAAATLGNAQVRDITISTSDLTPGTSALTTGAVYIVYEA